MSEDNKPERKIHILREDECPPCDEIIEANKDKIESGEITVWDVNSDEALKLLHKLGAPDRVPLPSALVEEEDSVKLCDIYHDKEVTLIACGNKIIAIRELQEEQPATKQSEEQPPPPTD